jgi:transposase InsO family protein
MKMELVLEALSMAYWQRKPDKGLVHHSDRGSRYACHEYQKQLQICGMTASMSRKGNCWDNAPTERFFRSLKKDTVNEILDYIT